MLIIKTVTTFYRSVIRKKLLILQQPIFINKSFAGTYIEEKGHRMKILLEKRSGRNRRCLLKKMYLIEDFLPSLQERTNRDKEYLTLYQKGGFGGGKRLASLSHSLLYKYFWKITTNWTYGFMIKKVHWEIVGRPRKTFSTSGVTFLTVRRLVKDTDQSREVSISKKFVSASEECLILQTPS